MILSDRDIRARLATGDLKISPIADEKVQLQPASVDLRLGREFLVYSAAQIACLDPREPEAVKAAIQRIIVQEGGAFILHPGEFALGTTVERVTIPHDLVARVDGRSSVRRLAIVVHATAGFIE